VEKAAMIDRASRLLVLLSGILDTGPGTKLGPKLMRIYGALQRSLLHANINNDVEALLEFEQAIDALARDMIRNAKIPAAA
jgi:flagellin-specific chaperone FliS